MLEIINKPSYCNGFFYAFFLNLFSYLSFQYILMK